MPSYCDCCPYPHLRPLRRWVSPATTLHRVPAGLPPRLVASVPRSTRLPLLHPRRDTYPYPAGSSSPARLAREVAPAGAAPPLRSPGAALVGDGPAGLLANAPIASRRRVLAPKLLRLPSVPPPPAPAPLGQPGHHTPPRAGWAAPSACGLHHPARVPALTLRPRMAVLRVPHSPFGGAGGPGRKRPGMEAPPEPPCRQNRSSHRRPHRIGTCTVMLSHPCRTWQRLKSLSRLQLQSRNSSNPSVSTCAQFTRISPHLQIKQTLSPQAFAASK